LNVFPECCHYAPIQGRTSSDPVRAAADFIRKPVGGRAQNWALTGFSTGIDIGVADDAAMPSRVPP